MLICPCLAAAIGSDSNEFERVRERELDQLRIEDEERREEEELVARAKVCV